MSAGRPLSGLRVVDLVDGPLAPITRYLAELGARVDRFVPATGATADIAANAGKALHAGPVDDAKLSDAHIIVAPPSANIDYHALAAENPALVLMLVSPFGIGNSFSDWQASDAVLHALSGSLSRSGIRGRAPLLPPGELAWQCAAAQGAYVVLAAWYKALRSGRGDLIDFSALDPGYGINGSATMGRPVHLLSRDRPAKGTQYPIFRCADGQVRICILASRQWQGMFRWMGEPEAFAGPEFTKISTRQQSAELQDALADFFRSRTRADLEGEGQAHGVPIASLLSFDEFAASEQVAARQALTELPLADGTTTTVANGVLTIDGMRMGPVGGATDADVPRPGDAAIALPFEGLKVLDLGVIVVGAEAGRMFADGGADVVKVESAAFPDGSRQSYLPYGLSASFAAGHRSKRSLGLDLRHEGGHALFLDLVRKADVLLSNFKPGTLDALGLDGATLAAINPRLVMADSSAFGPTGPWAKRLGYGPLVRAATGLTRMWRYADDPESFSDAVTVYPDHVAGRISALGALALLVRRERTGRGGSASVSQAEVMLAQFAACLTPEKSSAPVTAIVPAAGDDEWCVVTVAHEHDLASTADRVACLDAMSAARALQAEGLAAAPVLRVADLPDFAYYRERGSFRVDRHPYLPDPVTSESDAALFLRKPPAPVQPAPLAGEQSVEVVQDWLGLDRAEVEQLVGVDVLQPTRDTVFETIRKHSEKLTR
ncbi:Crotonobetainyl-CoA:carnitine CoA-transferase CaiB [Sphingopyxis sp. YR583]|uniref:CaiB/BaiF CoA-transferase family protein n=1 Tax=Sphingopyxis sp. YR583 TaxID=1881047 RepID=UPI0008A7A818|nr:CoA transferase [Sphingopyxis sp. YR583]SEH19322.1 Crotonobetainyl-CoA:carnitine CoA-transferase CaiB [Sphingopyxis sp. YR583]